MPRILIWNINALAPTVKNFTLRHGSIRGFFDSLGADIVCFQETKLMEEKLSKEMACVEGYESFWAFSEKKLGYSGVATYVKDEWSPVSVEVDSLGTLDAGLNGEGRIIVSDHGSFVLLNVYVPNAGKRKEGMSERADLKIRFLHTLKAKCNAIREEGKEVILVGDMNIAVSPKDVHSKFNWSVMYHPEELEVMRAILGDYTDVWRLQHPDASSTFTVWDEKTSARAFNEGCRIDYVLVSPGLLSKVGECRILGDLPPKWSDHAAILVDFEDLQPPPPHPPDPRSSRRMKKFNTRSQPSIAAMFARSRKPTVAAQPAAVAPQSTPQAAEADLQRSNAEATASAAQQDLPQSTGATAWKRHAGAVQGPDPIADAAASPSGRPPAASDSNEASILAEQIEQETGEEMGAAQLGHSPGQAAASGAPEPETRPRKRRKEDSAGSSEIPLNSLPRESDASGPKMSNSSGTRESNASGTRESSTLGGSDPAPAAALSSDMKRQAMQDQGKSGRQQNALESEAAKRGTAENRAVQQERGKGQSGIRSFFSPKKL